MDDKQLAAIVEHYTSGFAPRRIAQRHGMDEEEVRSLIVSTWREDRDMPKRTKKRPDFAVQAGIRYDRERKAWVAE